jgi:hypothetical protein
MLKLLVLSLFLLLNLDNAFAGGGGATGADDGGQGVICVHFSRNGGRFVNTLQSLDLFEMRAISGEMKKVWAHIDYNQPYREDEIRELLEEGRETVSRILGNAHPLIGFFNRAIQLKPMLTNEPPGLTNDFGKIQTKIHGDCFVVQVASRSRKSKIVKLHTDFAYMPDIDVAAILLHETLHEYFTEKDSNLVVRQTVGFIFADREFQIRNRDLFIELINTKTAIDPKRFK